MKVTATVAVFLCLMGQTVAEEETFLLLDASETAESLLQSWVDEFRISMVGPDHFEQYRLASLSESALDNIRLGAVKQIVFNYSDSVNFSLNVTGVTEKETNCDDSGSDTATTIFISWRPISQPRRA